MSSRPGFDVMDVDTSIANDPKFRRIHRSRPEHVAPAFMAYVALLGESWKAAERVTIEDAWPALLPFDAAVVESMTTAGLLDSTGRIPVRAWRKRFTEANQRRIRARDRYNRYNAKRGKPRTNDDGEATELPRGSDVGTAASEPFRTYPNRTVPNRPNRAPAAESNGHAKPPVMVVIDWLEQRTGRPYNFGEGSKVHECLVPDVRDFGADAVIAAYTAVASEIAHPDIGSVVFSATRVLHPVIRPTPEEEPDPAEVKRQLRERRQPKEPTRA